jgi:hypothetical protein
MTWEPEWQCELIQILTEEWENLNMGLINNLIGSIQRRIQRVIHNEGKSDDGLSEDFDSWRSDSQNKWELIILVAWSKLHEITWMDDMFQEMYFKFEFECKLRSHLSN